MLCMQACQFTLVLRHLDTVQFSVTFVYIT